MNKTSKAITVLLAEDDEDDVYLFKNALLDLRKEINVRTVCNGVECMDTLEQSSLPDMVFLDINMPMKSGFDCLDHIRKEDRLKTLKVVVLSTASTQTVIDTAYAKGADLYISKCVSYEEFKSLLSKCF